MINLLDLLLTEMRAELFVHVGKSLHGELERDVETPLLYGASSCGGILLSNVLLAVLYTYHHYFIL